MADQIQAELFEDDPGLGGPPVWAEVPLAGVARVLLPKRVQRERRACDLESLCPKDIGRGWCGPGSSGRT